MKTGAAAPAPPQRRMETAPPSTYEFRACPRCGREVRYNLTTQHFHSHTTPDGDPCYTFG